MKDRDCFVVSLFAMTIENYDQNNNAVLDWRKDRDCFVVLLLAMTIENYDQNNDAVLDR